MDRALFMFGLVAVSTISYCSSAEIPEFLKVCKRDEPNLTECIKHALEEIRPYLKKGVPEHNIPSVEPIIIKDLISEQSGGLKITTSDVVAYGGGDYIVNDLKVDMENHRFEIDVLLPKLIVDAKYTLDGKLVLVPIKGNGDFHANLTDCEAKLILNSEHYEKDGNRYVRFLVTDGMLKINVGGGKVKLDNLFSGDNVLNDVINDIINKNLSVFVKEILPFIEKALAKNLITTGNQIIEPYTIEQLFPK
ncbi:PREDICTED: uncharacterized protein LOC108565842 [Nicrophorus vespilloides]|uniref:Uncharacterized protein LOC108565842 n=1 Tax=Nicrophorus vespilloides TaxID=110193 RepID=A0ABM1N2D0_NICVS|nr:PREDICTED: uncharacterized protein LOC108565842 [Nicrophorus vespilloides]